MFICNRTIFAPYLVRIRYRYSLILYSYPHTIRSDSDSEKNMVTNTVSLISIRICSVFTPAAGTSCGSSSSLQACGQGMARGGFWVVLSPYLGFWRVLIATSSACLYRRHVVGNGTGRGIFFGHGQETIFGHARGKHEAASAGEFPPRGKPPVVIGDVPSPLTDHHQTIKL
jgi:hypothetical protein